MPNVAEDLFEQFVSRGLARIEQCLAQSEPETLHLDYKEWSGDWKKVLGKAASAFANVDGGVLVFGIEAKGTGNSDDAKVATNPRPLPNIIARTQVLLDSVSDLLDPRVPGIRCHAIPDAEGSDTGFIVVQIPASKHSPHQSVQHHSYFMRTGANSVHMPSSIVRAMVLAGDAPDLRIGYTIRYYEHKTEAALYWVANLRIENHGRTPAKNVAIAIGETELQILSQHPHTATVGGQQIAVSTDSSFEYGFRATLHRLQTGDVYPRTGAHVLNLRRTRVVSFEDEEVVVSVFADGFAETFSVSLVHDVSRAMSPKYTQSYETS